MSAGSDLTHTAAPLSPRSKPIGRDVMVNRCATCRATIWRTPERFVWSHSVPPRRRIIE